MNRTRLFKFFVISVLFAASIGNLPSLLSGPTGAPLAGVKRASAAPQSGGVFWVSTTADNTDADWDMSLAEAIILTVAGTGPSGLNRGLTDQELTHIGGTCNFDSNGLISLCGPGYSNTIYFLNTLGANPVIVLNTPLRGLVNTFGTTIDGTYSNIYPTIDASHLPPNQFGLTLNTNNVIKGVRVTGAPWYDFNVYGTNNQLINVAAWKAGGDGINIRTNGNVVDGALVGLASNAVSACGTGSNYKGNGGAGININTNVSYPSAKNNIVKNSLIGCNGDAGVLINGSGATNNTIGPNNLIGTRLFGGGPDLGNTGDGVGISAAANSNSILSNTIDYNGLNGISIADSSSNQLGGNEVRGNALDGVYITGNAHNNVIGGPSLLGAITSNWIGENSHNGVEIYGSLARYNLIGGNEIGTNPDGLSADANNLSGVVVDGAQDNYIGDNLATLNVIGGNKLNGVALYNGASGNSIAHNRIGVRSNVNLPLPNLAYGVLLDSGAHDNTIGGAQNEIGYSGLSGLMIQGSQTASNTVTNNVIIANGFNGVTLRAGAFNNTIGTAGIPNHIDANTGQGIEISGGAHDNVVQADPISNSSLNGVLLSDAGTTGNVISGTQISFNGGDAVHMQNGASFNVWSHLSTYNNGHAGLNIVPATGNTPVISSVVHSNSSVAVAGRSDGSWLFSSVLVEAYLARINAHGGVEITYWGDVPVGASGSWSISKSGALYPGIGLCFVAFETTTYSLFGTSSSSSMLGPDSCRVMMPRVSK